MYTRKEKETAITVGIMYYKLKNDTLSNCRIIVK